MEKKEVPPNLKEDNLTEETKSLITSLPSYEDNLGKLYNYQGCWYYPNTLQGVLNFQKGFKPQDTDIIITSLPKSGTTWLKALTIALLKRSKHGSHDHPLLSDNPHGIVPSLDISLYSKSSAPDLSEFSSSPRLFGTHMPYHAVREAVKDSPCKVVYVCRDMKDVLVSYWHFIGAFLETEVVERSFLDSLFVSFCKGVSYYGPFWEHVLSYWRGSLEDPKKVLFMRYEEMKAEPIAQVKRLAEFLDCPFTEEEEQSGLVEKILEFCSLRNLSNLEVNKTGKRPNNLPHTSFFRKGEVGDFKNHLTPEMVNKLNMIIEEKYEGSGLKF